MKACHLRPDRQAATLFDGVAGFSSLQRHVEANIVPLYEAFDKAHSVDHVETVIRESLALSRHFDVDVCMVYAVAAYHDLGLGEGRELHHLASGRILMADRRLDAWFSPEQLHIMREAVEDHRASSGAEPRSIYGKIVAEADRSIEGLAILRRTVQFGLKANPEGDADWHFARFLEHLQEKYADGGYLKLWIAQSGNSARLEELRAIIRDRALLRRHFDALFMAEKTGV